LKLGFFGFEWVRQGAVDNFLRMSAKWGFGDNVFAGKGCDSGLYVRLYSAGVDFGTSAGILELCEMVYFLVLFG
jgi:hypothetical protein